MQKKMFIVLIVCLTALIGMSANAQDNARTFYDAGLFAYEDGDYHAAEKNAKKALDLEPENPLYHHLLGKIYLKTEKYGDAEYYLNLVRIKNPDQPDFLYDWAFLKYKQKKYDESADLFTEVVKKNPSDALAHYHAGMSLYETKRYSKALNYLLKSAEMSSVIQTNASYYAGVCYWYTGNIKNAVEKFTFVKDHADTEELKANALNWLQTAETEQPKKAVRPYSFYLKLGYQHDDNVMLEPDEPLSTGAASDESDSAFEAFFSGSYNFINGENLVVGAGYSHYQTLHQDLNEYDLTGSMGNLYAEYRFQPFTFALRYLPSFFWVDFEKYLERHQFRPELTWQVNDVFSTKFSYTYSVYDYFKELDENRDGNVNEFGVDAYYNILSKSYLFGGLGYEKNSADADESYGGFNMKAGVSLELPWALNLLMTTKYYSRDYDDEDIQYKVKREDTKYFAGISLSRRIYQDWLKIQAEFDYTKNDSNLKDYEYDRKVTGLSFIAEY